MDSKAGYARGVSFVLLATLGWSLSGLFVRLMPELDGWQINCWRGFWLGVALLVYLIAAHGRDTLNQFDSIPFPALLISAVCFAAGTTFYVSALKLASTATVSVIGATSPLIAALFSKWVTGERPHFLSWVCAVIALVGMAVIAQHGIQVGNSWGLILSFGVPITFAFQTLLLRKYRDKDMMVSICAGGFIAFIVTGVGAEVFGYASAFSIQPRSFELLILMGVVQLAIPLVCYGRGAKTVPAVSLALISMLDAVINPFWPWLFVGERPETTALIGGAIILGAVVLSTIGSRLFVQNGSA